MLGILAVLAITIYELIKFLERRYLTPTIADDAESYLAARSTILIQRYTPKD